ncbi:TetR family transcriptional regulator [Haloactinospora alba]|uniref:TetR family transcriptional regulator n=1 Tax=Haloactinospora alba TaxID=405555 RepID=A0A543N7I9_9ACTN|nr:TetR/AcrR family transcriptional regulator [Haloactinospora alba]TQN27780.1 TetR family transcriptional regulator [Haloactinospora alba]
MARTKEFDPQRVLESAMGVFWRKGYEGTSAQDLCDATGLGRSSLYNAFDGKHDLFLRALKLYVQRFTQHNIELISGDGSIRERVGTLLWDVVEQERSSASPGCFAVNSAMERARTDPDVAAVVERDRAAVVDALHQALRTAQAEGEIAPDADPLALARFLHSTIGSLRLLGRTPSGRAAMPDVVATTLAAL